MFDQSTHYPQKTQRRLARSIDPQAIRKHVEQGGNIRDFAKQVGLSENTIRTLCRLHKIPTFVWKTESMVIQDCAWVAACLDCEGMITARAVPNQRRAGSRNVALYAKVEMTCALVPKRLQEICGGRYVGPKPKAEGCKATYEWAIGPNGCRYVLPQIMPFLLTKKRRAEIALEILAGNRKGRSMPNDQLIPLLAEMHELNRRGGPEKGRVEQLRVPVCNDRTNEMIPCACGCGKAVLKYDRRGRTRSFLHGHNGLGRG